MCDNSKLINNSNWKLENSLDQGLEKTINWFLKNGHRSNSLRNGYKEAKEILDKALNLSISSTWSSSHNGGRINKYWLVDHLISNNYDVISFNQTQEFINISDILRDHFFINRPYKKLCKINCI